MCNENVVGVQERKMYNADILGDGEPIDYLHEDFTGSIDELDRISEVKIKINEGLEEALTELESLHDQFSKEGGAQLLNLCKTTVMETITGQFGLAGMFIETKDGGNVTTAHNFKKGITASDADKQKYDNFKNQDYQGTRKDVYDPIHQKQRERYQPDKEGMVLDEYTGQKIPFENANLDHIVPIKEIEENAKAHLSMEVEERANMACSEQNYAVTSESANKSKGAKSMTEFVETDKAKELGIDKNAALPKDDNARKYVHRTIDIQLTKKYTKELAITGAKDAGMIAAYTALGVIMREMTQAIFDEIRTTFRERGKESLKEIFVRFKERIKAACAKIMAKWKDILGGSFEKGIIAFLSNIVVFVINLFATVLKKLVRMIRAGFVSLYQAIKMLANPPKGMSREEASYQALKILTAGLIGAASLGLSAGIETLLKSIPGLQPLMMFPVPLIGKTVSDVLATTLSALVGGVLITIVLYFMDKFRSEGQKDKLRFQLIAQSGLVVQCKIAQTYCVLGDAYRFLDYRIEQEQERLNQTRDTLRE